MIPSTVMGAILTLYLLITTLQVYATSTDTLLLQHLERAIKKHQTKTVYRLIALGADIHRPLSCMQYGTILHLAARDGNKDIIKCLIKARARVYAKDINGYTPLHYAAMSNKDTTEALIAAGACVNAQSNNKNMPLHLAVSTSNNDTVHMLLKYGASVNACNSNGCTPLHEAAFYDSYDVVDTLMRYKASYKARDNEGKTPLVVACEEQNKKTACVLLKRYHLEIERLKAYILYSRPETLRGCVIQALFKRYKCNEYITALKIARHMGHSNVITHLTQATTEQHKEKYALDYLVTLLQEKLQ